MARKLKARIAKLEDVDEALRDLYEEAEDGKGFVLIPEGIDDEVAGPLKRALKTEREKAEEKLKQRFGLTGEELEAKLKQMDEAEKAKERNELEQRKQFDKLLESHKAETAKELKRLNDERAALEAELTDALVVGSATRAIAQKKGKVKALLPNVLGRLKLDVDPETKKRVVRVIDDKGEARTSKGGWLDVDGLLEEMKGDDEYSSLFESDVVPGGGATSTKRPAGGGKTMTRQQFDALSPTEKMATAKQADFKIEG